MNEGRVATYRATQSSYVGALVMIAVLAATGLWVASDEDASTASFLVWVLVGALAVVGVVFSRLIVVVGRTQVLAEFGAGWPRKRIELVDVVDVSKVRNHWYHGWGLRKVKDGWMYNVWGLDAVELRLASGKVFRIGTDEPDQLRAAIEAARARLD